MKNFFRNIGIRIQQGMVGRYGYDELSRAMSIAALIGLILSCIPGFQFMYIPTIILWAWSMFRCYSRNLEKRRNERSVWLGFMGRIKGWFVLTKRAWKERKTHCFFRCKQCNTILRIPRGKGKILITCPKCNNEIVKKT